MLKLNPSQVQTYILLSDLNTSYVEVKHKSSCGKHLTSPNLNTSYVEVKHKNQKIKILIKIY